MGGGGGEGYNRSTKRTALEIISLVDKESVARITERELNDRTGLWMVQAAAAAAAAADNTGTGEVHRGRVLGTQSARRPCV
jgi:hypothetical protein